MKVTVIIPVHNSGKYLKECIESALSQNFQEIEVICIDGGSTDNSYEIIEELQKKDSRITYIQDPNTSYGHKINVGIDRASGRYISILESDDKMVSDMVLTLYLVAEKYDADIVDADYYELFKYKGKNLKSVVRKYPNPQCYNHAIEYSDGADRNITYHGIWTALYKREFLIEQNIRLNESEGASYQDLSFLFLTSILAQKVYHINIPLYQYRVDNINSSVRDGRKVLEVVGECEFLKAELEKRDVLSGNIKEKYYMRKYNAYYWNFCRLINEARACFLTKYLQELSSDIQEKEVARGVLGTQMYEQTFLLLDNQEEFLNVVHKRDERKSLVDLLDLLDSVQNEGLVVFGAGILGKWIVDILLQNGNRLQVICDNSKLLQGTMCGDLEICSVERAIRKYPRAFYLIMNRKEGANMKKQLLCGGIQEEKIYVYT